MKHIDNRNFSFRGFLWLVDVGQLLGPQPASLSLPLLSRTEVESKMKKLMGAGGTGGQGEHLPVTVTGKTNSN